MNECDWNFRQFMSVKITNDRKLSATICPRIFLSTQLSQTRDVKKSARRENHKKNPGHVTLPFADHENPFSGDSETEKIKLRRVVDKDGDGGANIANKIPYLRISVILLRRRNGRLYRRGCGGEGE